MKIMKALLFLFLFISTIASAQEDFKKKIETRNNGLKISPIRAIIYKFNIEYERKLNPYFSAGAVSDIYHAGWVRDNDKEYWNGIQAFKNSLYTRFYPWGNGLRGFYIQGKIIMVNYYDFYDIDRYTYKVKKDSIFNNYTLISSQEETRTKFVNTFGGSIGFGYQALLGKQKRFLLDSKLEIQLVPSPHSSDEEYITEEFYDENDNFLYREHYHIEEGGYEDLNWILAGPGALIYPSIKFGYLF